MADGTSSQWDAEIRRRLSDASLNPASEVEIVRELAQHLDDRYAELRAEGLSAGEARRRTLEELREEALMRRELARLGPGEQRATVPAETPGRSLWPGVWNDLRYAARMLKSSPGFTAATVLTLALGIGATTAIFSVVDAMLIRPIVYDPAGRLVTVRETRDMRGRTASILPAVQTWREWRARNDVFEAMAFEDPESLTLLDASPIERVRGTAVTPDFFALFDAVPMLGRGFDEADAQQPVTAISYGCWQRRFGGSADVIGRTVRMLEGSRTIIGVLPRQFAYAQTTDFFIPLDTTPMTMPGWGGWSLARLRPEITVAEAQRRMTALARQLEHEGVMRKGAGIAVRSLREDTVGDARTMLYILMTAVGFILLIGCVNVAGLVTARGAGRAREIAIRASLGASRARLARQLLTESLVLALLGGTAGVLLARWTLGVLVPMLPVSVPTDMPPAIDARVLVFALLLSCGTGVLFGLWPGVRWSRAARSNVLTQTGSGLLRSGRTGRTLVAVEVALALMLLVAAGLMVRSLQQLLAIDPGFDPEHVLVAEVSPARVADGQDAGAGPFYRALLERIGGVPGVEAAGGIDTLPFWSTAFSSAEIEGRDPRRVSVSPRYVLPGYFEAMGIPLKAGRELTEDDDERAPCAAIINEDVARQHWPGENPLGHRVRYIAEERWCEIVGVVGNIRHQSLEEKVLPELYLAAFQSKTPEFAIIVRTENPDSLVRTLRAELASLTEPVLIERVVPFEALVARSTENRERRAFLLSGLGGLGLVLACVGIFGLTGYAVARRTPEIGIRMALGASPSRVLRTVMGTFVTAIAIGLTLGLFGAWAARRVIAQYLFQVQPTDPVTLITVSAILTGVAVVSCYLPARRALRVDPVVALRAE